MTSNSGATFIHTLPSLAQEFRARFASSPSLYQAPARVNLIGEHTDYNDGFVMPAAIGFFTSVAIAPRGDRHLVIESDNFHERRELSLDDIPERGSHQWSDYVAGVAKVLEQSGHRLAGANLLISGNVPLGAGLSSSASLEVAVATALLGVSGISIKQKDLALLCQRAENEFVGARCGIMDQFIVAHAQHSRALLLDCRSLEYRHLPLPTQARLVICNTGVRHSVAAGEYNHRRAECEEGVRLLSQHLPGVKALRDVAPSDFEPLAADLPPIVMRRCRHVIAENTRVIHAAAALEAGDLNQFGNLMRQSHISLRDDFEVSCRELDVMVELAQECPGVYGARMTGGGFGGCTINLVQSELVEQFRSIVAAGYQQATGTAAEIYVCSAVDGVKRVS